MWEWFQSYEDDDLGARVVTEGNGADCVPLADHLRKEGSRRK